jgi:arylsulfatase A-like enzyme
MRALALLGMATTAFALTPQRNSSQTQRSIGSRPHIAYLLVDDWGWANFGPHRELLRFCPNAPGGMSVRGIGGGKSYCVNGTGANSTIGNDEFPTPNLAALAQEGIMLNRMYVACI